MRISRLELLRYGHFTDMPIEFPAQSPDIHILFGPNEAGKTTALSAIEDLLFGIPQSSQFGFLHDYANMRIGAALENEDQTIEIRRRKGKKDTILKPDDMPFLGGDSTLSRFLDGADRGFFERMFSLSQDRLRKGGREILEAQDEVGQMLFSAGAGIAGLRDKLKSLEEEADGLWASRRAGHRKFYLAQDRLKEAESAIHQHMVTAQMWQERKSAYEKVEQTCRALDHDIEEKTVEQRKMSRIRRVYRDVRRRTELDDKVAGLGDVVPLPEDARQTLEVAERDDANTTARIGALTEQMEKGRKERDTLTCNDALLLREADIRALHEWRIKIRDGKTSLPKRRAELASAETDLQRLAGEIEWETGDIEKLVARIPTRVKVNAVHALLTRRGERLSVTENAKSALEDAEEKIVDLRQQLGNRGSTVDVSKLAAALKATSELGDIATRISVTEGAIQDLQAAVKQRLQRLKPEVTDEKVLTAITIPPRDSVQIHRDAVRDMERRWQTCVDDIRTAEQEVIRHRKAYERVTRDEDAVSPEELACVRAHRDAGWLLVRRRHIEGATVPEDEILNFTGENVDLADAYESTVQNADHVVDRRFEKAEAAAHLDVISEKIAEQQDLLEGIRQEGKALIEESLALDAEWQGMWMDASISPLSPEIMLEWIASRTEIAELIERRGIAERQVAALRGEESRAKEILLAEIEALGVEPGSLKACPLRVAIEAAADMLRRHERNAEARRQMEEELRMALIDIERKRKALEKALGAWSEWGNQWADAIDALGLNATASPDAIATQVDVIDHMREITARIHDLRHERIDKIERDNAVFDVDVAETVAAIATDLADEESEDAVIELESRLEETKRNQDLQKQKDKDLASLKLKTEEGEESRRAAREVLRHLQKIAKAENIADLGTAIERSDSLRDLKKELIAVTEALAKEGDGLTIAELQDECEDIDIDHIATRERVMEQELKELHSRLLETQGQRTAARREFEAIGGDSAAAQAAAIRQEALAEMQDVVEKYVRVRSSALLLKWAIDRFRLEKQAPILRRAGQLFSTLTDGSFTGLQVEFDDQDRTHLAGSRPGGSTVRTEGMSTGTGDQLFLALRIASVEDYLNRAAPLPFIADDLFIHFDDERAAAGFKVLGELAQRTQVLFFTHHKHLLDIARKALGQAPSITRLKYS
jgi:uncharacterized protein YhaN